MAKKYKQPDPVTMADYQSVSDAMAGAQQKQLDARIPNARGLEESSSAQIANLLNPPSFFSDQDRRAAEIGASRGLPGAAAAYSGGLVMNADEQLKRIALGQQMLSAADTRNPVAALPDPAMFNISPYQKAVLDQQRYNTNTEANIAFSRMSTPSTYSQGMPNLGATQPIYAPAPSSSGVDMPTSYYGTGPVGGVKPSAYSSNLYGGISNYGNMYDPSIASPSNLNFADYASMLTGGGNTVGTGFETNADYGAYQFYGE